MRNLRFRRLGLLGVATTLALIGAALSPAAAIGPSTYAPGLVISKTWLGSVNGGGTATSRITLNNTGGSHVTQNDVLIVDSYDPGLTYVAGSASGANGVTNLVCTDYPDPGFRRVVCTADMADNQVGTIDLDFKGSYWGPQVYTKNFVSDERLEIQKAETHVDIWSDTETTATVTCPANYNLIDHSWHLQQVDQDTGDFEDVYINDRTVDHTSATYKIFNDAGGKAQGKLWALCLKNTTNDAHPVTYEGFQHNETIDMDPLGPHERPLYAECPDGYTPVAINVRAVTNGFSDAASSYMDDLIHWTGLEADGSRRATVWIEVRDHAKVTLQWRCLNTKVGAKRMAFNVKTASVPNVPMHDKVAQKQITCDHHYKGIIGGWRGGKFNGSEPRPITRVYWLWHDYNPMRSFTGKLLCLQNRLVRGGKLQKNGTVTDNLWNFVFGTTQNNGFYIWNTDYQPISVTQS